jgi:enoyl-CoA hydratase/carnithine racemase
MGFIELQRSEGIATLTLRRGKVNALNGALVDQLRGTLKTLEGDSEVKAIVLTGAGKFFSFGFDIPEFLSFTKDQFTEYLINFTDLYTHAFLLPQAHRGCAQWPHKSRRLHVGFGL